MGDHIAATVARGDGFVIVGVRDLGLGLPSIDLQILHGSATTTGDLGGRERTSADIEADIASEVTNFAKPKTYITNGLMSTSKADKDADIKAAEDRGESVGVMEPMLISESSRHRTELADLAITLATESAAFRSSLPEGIIRAPADLVGASD